MIVNPGSKPNQTKPNQSESNRIEGSAEQVLGRYVQLKVQPNRQAIEDRIAQRACQRRPMPRWARKEPMKGESRKFDERARVLSAARGRTCRPGSCSPRPRGAQSRTAPSPPTGEPQDGGRSVRRARDARSHGPRHERNRTSARSRGAKYGSAPADLC